MAGPEERRCDSTEVGHFTNGPVWTALYICMAVAARLIWRRGGFQQARTPLTLFAVQLSLNAAWSWIFFGCHMPGIAFLEILVLLTAIAATTVAFWPRSKAAGRSGWREVDFPSACCRASDAG